MSEDTLRSAMAIPKNYSKPCAYGPQNNDGASSDKADGDSSSRAVDEKMAPSNGQQHDML